MIRRIIKIDEDKCNGCGLCATACHEGAIAMVDGKAKLTREDYCDGLGDCLPACPMAAISFEEREAPAYNEAAVLAAKRTGSALNNFPIQLRLVSPAMPAFQGAELLIAADCTAYAYGNFHNTFMKDKVTLIGCPKLDPVDYSEKLTQIFSGNDIRSVTVVRMPVPCCGGLPYAVEKAVSQSGKHFPVQTITLSASGEIVDKREN